ncbi:LacI family DNA-binding transcriptional regulator [Brachybacterium squillarum]|uniref:LacI family DNA-binding transcriptional regulator n=1 Tax=Brachybacterium squillarum TaxID=661979 RepID=UPI0002629856|nr:LacI family DNA-binding transcriptional regulator [Brachybacterium squillarum]
MAKVTLSAVAERAGVSLATASKVMNGRADVKDSTRLGVQEAARRLGYTPRRRDPDPIGSVVIAFDALNNPYSIEILHGATLAARRAGLDLAVTTMEDPAGDDGPPILGQRWFREMAERGHAAVISVTAPVGREQLRWSRDCSLPLLVIDPITVDAGDAALDGLVRISATNWAGGRAATQHLIDLGHRRIAIAMGTEDSAPVRERFDGYRSALEQAGIPFDPDLVAGSRYSFEEGLRAGRALLEELPAGVEPPTAIFATSDTIALGLLRVAHERGLRVPEQLSIIGFDDTLLASWTNPQLTVIKQPLFAMGQVAVERALALAQDPSRFALPFQLETHLVQRESTAPPPTPVR